MSGSGFLDVMGVSSPSSSTSSPAGSRERELCQGNLESEPNLIETIEVIYISSCTAMVMSTLITIICLSIINWKRGRRQTIQARPPLLGYHYRKVFQRGGDQNVLLITLPHQQKPFFLDLVKILVEMLVLVMALGLIEPKAALVIWSVYDQLAFVYVVCLWVAGRRRLDDQRTGATTLLLYSVYCIIFGVPFGCIFKITSIDSDFPGTDHISPLYAELIVVPVVLVLYLLKQRGCKWRTVRWVGATVLFCGALVTAFVSAVICRHYLCADYDTHACHGLLYSWLFSFTPMALELHVAGIYFMIYVYRRGELMRYISEISSMLSWSLVLVTYFYSVDTGNQNVQFMQIIWILHSIFATISSNLYVVKQLYAVQQLALRHRSGREAVGDPTLAQDGSTSRSTVDVSQFHRESTLRASLADRLKTRNHDTACPICFDEFRSNEADVVVGVIKSCGHYFHLSCLVQWLDSTKTCPVCRGDTALDMDAIKAISYFDLRRVVGINVNRRIQVIGQSPNNSILRSFKNKRAKLYQTSSHTNPAYEENENGTDSNAVSRATTPSNTLDRNRQRCAICRERYEDNPQFMVVGYMPRCGHYFHFRCIWNYVMRHNQCPTCAEESPEGVSVQAVVHSSEQPEQPPEVTENPSPSGHSEETPSVSVNPDLEIVMALLSHVC